MNATGLAAATLCACASVPPGPLASEPLPPAPETDALKLDWDASVWAFDVPMLPAISADGTMIVIAKSEPLRGEPYVTGRHPSLDLLMVTRTDAVANRFPVLSAEDADAMFDDGVMTPELRERVAAADRWLQDIDRRYHLIALDPLDVVRALDMPTHVRSHAVGAGITVDWAASHLDVVQQPGRTLVHATTPATWLAPDHPTPCPTATPNLETVYGDVARRAIVLEIAYGGVVPDTCIRPPSQVHVAAW